MARPHEVVIKCTSGAQARRVEALVRDGIRRGELLARDAAPDVEVRDVTPCRAVVHHGPGGQSTTRCEVRGRHGRETCPRPGCPGHDVHEAHVMGLLEDWAANCAGEA